MFVYFNTENDEIYAITEYNNLVPPSDMVEVVEYDGEVPVNINFALFDGAKFYGRPDDQVEIMNALESNENNLQFLKNTDWYVLRSIETGEPIPKDVKDARYKARKAIIDIGELMERQARIAAGEDVEKADKKAERLGMMDGGMRRV